MKRFIQLITGFHKIHHVTYSFGIKIPLTGYGYFICYAKNWKKSPFQKLNNGKFIGVNGKVLEKNYINIKT